MRIGLVRGLVRGLERGLTDDMGWGDVSYNAEYLQPGAGENFAANPPRTPDVDALATRPPRVLFTR